MTKQSGMPAQTATQAQPHVQAQTDEQAQTHVQAQTDVWPRPRVTAPSRGAGQSHATLRTRTLRGGALASVLALGVLAPYVQAATPTALPSVAPVGLGPWTAPDELPGVTGVVDLQSTRDGTLAGLFVRDGRTVLSVRPAGSTTWQPATPAPGRGLQRTDDGAVSLLWWTDPEDGGAATLKMSRLAPDGTAFTPAEDVTTGTVARAGDRTRTRATTLASDARGQQAVAWMDEERRLTVVERSGPDGAWSAPKTLDRLPDPIVGDDHVYAYALWDLRVAVDPAGTVGVIWGGNSFYEGDGVDPDPSAHKWHYRYLEKPAGAAATWAAPRELPQLGEKPRQVTLAAHPQGGFQLLSHGGYARKAAGAAQWGEAVQIGVGARPAAPADLLTAPNGDITAVGMRGPGEPAVATRLASRGGWGAARKLASNVDGDSLGAVAGAGGAVVVTYTQKRFELGRVLREDFVAQVVEGGDPSKPRTLGAQTKDTVSTGRAAVDGKGRPVAVWTRTAGAGGAATAYTATTGTRGAPKWHDYADDSRGDVVGLSFSDSMKLYTGDTTNPTDTFYASPWDEKTRVVPFGDFDGDRCNDLIVRLPDGETRLYTPACGGGLPAPDSAYKRLARDWSRYDTLFASGDQTGDGRPDLLARDKATGDVYLYAADGSGAFAPRVRIRAAWTGYPRVIGAGDLNGDGLGDVLALDKSGELWRYDGLRTGRLKDRVQVSKDWGASYKDVIGAGDVNGDGRQDLLARDTSHRLWLNAGKGDGSFAGRVAFGAAEYWKTWASLA
ncbi:VCBS repeat-containing protein [Streptomyces sp. NPDC005900]|uniref:FG-GAP repeat domain-containing protein n=1 Tax=Streptomyces sp. NPDC005900 TaxID=3154569 RepID=UPI0033E55490